MTGQTDSWEITFHDDNGGEPAATLPEGGISQHFVSSGAVDPDNDGIYYYSALWNPQDLLLTAGTDYWFSVANASGAGWTWANGLVPTIGSEQYNAAVSTGVGPNGGPHFGPWDTVMTNFAFRIHVDPIPEPPMLALLGIALAAMGLVFKVKECAS